MEPQDGVYYIGAGHPAVVESPHVWPPPEAPKEVKVEKEVKAEAKVEPKAKAKVAKSLPVRDAKGHFIKK